MNYAERKQLPGFCYVCNHVCTPERHARALERRREIQANRLARQAAAGVLCWTCVGPHDAERHERYKEKAAKRAATRKQRPAYCNTCQGPHRLQLHERKLRHRRKLHRWKKHRCDMCEGKHDRQRHRQKLQEEYDKIQVLKDAGQWCTTCHAPHDDNRHARYMERKRLTWQRWAQRWKPHTGRRSRRLPQVAVQVPEHYPYTTDGSVTPDIVTQVAALVPRALPDDVRADVCQEILMALLEGREQLATLDVSRYVRQGYRALTGYVELSIYATTSTAQDNDQTIADLLVSAQAVCPDCGGPVIYAEGCKACGWRCGWNDCL